ncbi:thiamine pyrophosphate-binding protein [Parafrankia sp. BMG5.11]|uniref:thiamine pyrophosphate-binding protein n=1 Tax=Parafrankia sp. BMG5.11 TaxID=222540 RepID=UPI00103DEA71|nr:thiamine pyrophosphate-binding protein [Parafrankia sp. BMG5.11]TCJ39771.1 thiamine pyrophosphate-binding protein [Parafrankia sp. BMG5.11]
MAQSHPAGTRMTGGQILIRELLERGVDTIFCVPGESYLAALDAIHEAGDRIKLVVCRHEAGAANMAEAWGKLTKRPGVCFVTRGPGACHAAIGVHTAQHDSTPMLLFVGQVPRDQMGRGAFQEVDYPATFGALAKWACQIDDAARIPEFISRAYATALGGRPGPVVIALPEDMLSEAVEAPGQGTEPAAIPGAPALREFQALLATAERPLLVLGGSQWSAQGLADLTRFVEASGIPVTCGFRRQDLFDNRHPQYVGESALGINPRLKARWREADLIVAVGTRLGEIVTDSYTNLDVPLPGPKLVHVLPEASELGRVYQPTLAITADVNAFAKAAAALELEPRWDEWRTSARADYEAWQQPPAVHGPVDMARIVGWLSDTLPDDAILTNGAGNYAIWLHRFFRYKRSGTQLAPTSGAMGYGLPAAIAAGIRHPDRPVICFAGDGCFMMASTELATIVRHRVPVIVVVVNNGAYGTIRMHQERRYPGHVVGTELVNPDFAALAQSYGIGGWRVERTEDFAPAFEAARASGEAALIEIVLPTAELSPTMKLAG